MRILFNLIDPDCTFDLHHFYIVSSLYFATVLLLYIIHKNVVLLSYYNDNFILSDFCISIAHFQNISYRRSSEHKTRQTIVGVSY